MIPAGEREAVTTKEAQLEYLMRRFGDRVVQLAFSYLKDRDEAEDAAQEVFLRAYGSLDRFRGDSSPYTWIYRITVNLCRDRLRKRRPLIFGDLQGACSLDSDPESEALASFEERTLYEAVHSLPLPFREVVILHYLNGLTVREIAEVTGSSISLVKVRLHRARLRLKKLLEDRGVDAP